MFAITDAVVWYERPLDRYRDDSHVNNECGDNTDLSGRPPKGRGTYSWAGLPSTVIPMDRAVPATMLAPFSTVWAFRS